MFESRESGSLRLLQSVLAVGRGKMAVLNHLIHSCVLIIRGGGGGGVRSPNKNKKL